MSQEFLGECRSVWQNFSLEEHIVAQLELSYCAGVYEAEGKGYEAGPLWQAVVVSQEMQAGLNPVSAFRYARWLVMLDERKDGATAHIQWLQGNGMQQLTDPRLKQFVAHLLVYGQDQAFTGQLSRFIQTSVSWDKIQVMNDLSFHPECFLHFVGTLLALQLPDRSEIAAVASVKELAASQLGKPEFLRVVKLYAAIHDTAKMAQNLLELSHP